MNHLSTLITRALDAYERIVDRYRYDHGMKRTRNGMPLQTISLLSIIYQLIVRKRNRYGVPK